MTTRSRFATRTWLVGLALAVAASSAAVAPAQAAPALPDPSTLGLSALGLGNLQSLSLSGLPGDTELADALRTLKSTGLDQSAITALTSILGAQGSPDLSTLGQLAPGTTTPGTSTPGITAPANPTAPAPAAPVAPAAPAAVVPNAAAANPAADPITDAATGLELFEKISGAKLLTPALAPFCAPTSAENPLGLVAAPAVALPGPFPKTADGKSVKDSATDLLKLLGVPDLGKLLDTPEGKDLTEALNDKQTAFALVPPATHTNDKFQVAWFNTASMKGGFADLTTLDKLTGSNMLAALAKTAPIRLARVDTGQGSILTAVFGTTTNAGRTCYFLPAVGMVNTPAA